ncbi:citrate-binding protein-like [Triticum urartu]|uniref:Alginate lyase 2 domain-containing protein n=1 Tax=Triticum urartu TaxID=4572 RepID=A0A8R7PQ62_TRIUA|nr:citrate-binding protein-like [Triticum urartu]XP_048567675.1 citrate-binding protein-like [Triticum urartu]
MASLSSSPWLHLLLFLVAMGGTFAAAGGSGNPTAGFQKVQLADGDFQVQSPYNVPESQRFQYRNGVRTFWVHRNDKPFNTVTHTNPRSEVKLRGHDYSSGVWQFEGYGYVPSGTSGVSVMQIHNEEGAAHSTVLMLHVYDGVLRFYSGAAIEPDIYDRWFRLNVMHDVGASTVAVYVDGERKFSTSVTPSESYYFKFGVYMQHHDQSSCMESRWTNVTLYTKH